MNQVSSIRCFLSFTNGPLGAKRRCVSKGIQGLTLASKSTVGYTLGIVPQLKSKSVIYGSATNNYNYIIQKNKKKIIVCHNNSYLSNYSYLL